MPPGGHHVQTYCSSPCWRPPPPSPAVPTATSTGDVYTRIAPSGYRPSAMAPSSPPARQDRADENSLIGTIRRCRGRRPARQHHRRRSLAVTSRRPVAPSRVRRPAKAAGDKLNQVDGVELGSRKRTANPSWWYKRPAPPFCLRCGSHDPGQRHHQRGRGELMAPLRCSCHKKVSPGSPFCLCTTEDSLPRCSQAAMDSCRPTRSAWWKRGVR